MEQMLMLMLLYIVDILWTHNNNLIYVANFYTF